MARLSRRRFLQISAGVAMTTGLRPALAAEPLLTQWKGTALGARATITLGHPDAEHIIDACRIELERLEAIFSLHRPDSALCRLNATGRLDDPPFEMLTLLDLCASVHEATGGLFDPTVQPLWDLYTRSHASGRAPQTYEIASTLTRVGWEHVRHDTSEIAFARKGMALTLNGIAQGYMADRLVAYLRSEGLTDILVNTGEFRALGGRPDGLPWPIRLDSGDLDPAGAIGLRESALAVSSPAGTAFDQEGEVGHILHPITGMPAPNRWRLVAVSGPFAALADGLTTAMCLMSRKEMEAALAHFPPMRLVRASWDEGRLG